MKVLLIGEYSNVHWTLAQGLRQLGHEVTVVSDGDDWKNYPRDIDLRRASCGRLDTLRYLWRLHRLMPTLRGYDVVQIINPVFLDLRAQRIWPYYQRLRRQNRSLFMGAFGMDYYWVKTCMDCSTFLYSDFNMGQELRTNAQNDQFIAEWLHGPKGTLNQQIAADCDGIVTGLYEYEMCYQPHFPDKTRFIPFPIQVPQYRESTRQDDAIRFFIGIQRTRSQYKGTDVMLRALLRLKHDYPERVIVEKAESVPFDEYQRMIERSDVLLDQLYSYTPAMNGLLAMSRGLVLVGGGEEEHYHLLGENELRPIINVRPNEDDVYRQLEQLVLHPERVPELKRQSVEYIRRHHDYMRVAQKYLKFWTERMQLSRNE